MDDLKVRFISGYCKGVFYYLHLLLPYITHDESRQDSLKNDFDGVCTSAVVNLF